MPQQEIILKPDAEQSETILFNAGAAGAHSFQIGIEPLAGEQNTQNNSVVRLINVAEKKMRILYFEGEPRWEFKFIRRADGRRSRASRSVTILRTTQNKIYRQSTTASSTRMNWKTASPTKAEELFALRRPDHRQRGSQLFQHRTAGT